MKEGGGISLAAKAGRAAQGDNVEEEELPLPRKGMENCLEQQLWLGKENYKAFYEVPQSA
jgi:hypothetical protein